MARKPRMTSTKSVYAVSQITRKRPSKRLIKRRLADDIPGYFPNPIKQGYSRATISFNVGEMVKAGYPQAQAVKIALNYARVAYRKKYPAGPYPPELREPETVRKNPAPSRSKAAKIASAMKLYKKFSGHEAQEVGRMKKPEFPDVGIVIGEMDGVTYETIRDGVKEKYFHRFDKKSRPLLISSHDGHSIYIVGGRYDFTEDGIVDK